MGFSERYSVKEERADKYKRCCPHFINRLKERYNIDFTVEDYNKLNTRQFRGVFGKGANTIGTMLINGKTVWVLYNPRLKLFTSAYPANLDSTIEGMITACFNRTIRPFAYALHAKIKDELEKYNYAFNSEKEAALFFFNNTAFPNLLIEQYKYNYVRISKIIHCIHKVLIGHNPYVKLTFEIKTKEIKQLPPQIKGYTRIL